MIRPRVDGAQPKEGDPDRRRRDAEDARTQRKVGTIEIEIGIGIEIEIEIGIGIGIEIGIEIGIGIGIGIAKPWRSSAMLAAELPDSR